jgi:hypothetical protein
LGAAFSHDLFFHHQKSTTDACPAFL